MPRFGFSNPGEVRDIATFLIGLVDDFEVKAIEFKPDAREAEIIAGRRLVRSKNCQACHIIEGEGGDVWPAISERKWQPPDLRGQGLKTQPDWLFKFLKAPERLRPWHSINMPTFDLTDEQARILVKYFALLSEVPYPFEGALTDGLVGPDGKPVPYARPKTLKLSDPKDRTRKVTRAAKNALEEARYMFEEYQCESCHAPEAGVVPEGNRAPVFTLVRDGRLRPPWIRLWLYGPLTLQPGTAMPAFFTKGQPQKAQFFGGSAAAQIRALNDYLNYHYPTKKR